MPGRWEESLEEHEALIDAIEAQDAEKASELARLHFTKAREIRLDLWSQSTV
jgi:DNA-binding GntR family transcriptional regulator